MIVEFSNQISVKDYNDLRGSVGWREIGYRQAKKGLKNSVFTVTALIDKKPAGMARIVSDGGYVLLIVDVMVRPCFQKMGIGKQLMQRIMDYIHSNIHKGDYIHINLMAAKGREGFYRQFGFTERPNEDYGAGMTLSMYYE